MADKLHDAAKHALRHLYAHDRHEGNSHILDDAVMALERDKSHVGVKTALGHIERNDDYEGNSERVDRAARILGSALKGHKDA